MRWKFFNWIFSCETGGSEVSPKLSEGNFPIKNFQGQLSTENFHVRTFRGKLSCGNFHENFQGETFKWKPGGSKLPLPPVQCPAQLSPTVLNLQILNCAKENVSSILIWYVTLAVWLPRWSENIFVQIRFLSKLGGFCSHGCSLDHLTQRDWTRCCD